MASQESFNSLASGRWSNNSKSVISEHMLRIKFVNSFCEIATQLDTPEYIWWHVNFG